MTFKDYFLLTKTTTKSCLIKTSTIFTIAFVLIFVAMKIGNKLGEEETFKQVYNSIGRFVFIYGLALFIWACALISAYSKAKTTLILFNTIPLNIRDKFCLQLHHVKKNIEYNYLEFKIVGLYENNNLVIDKLQKNIRIILCETPNSNLNFQRQIIHINKKYKKENIELNGYGLLKKFNVREWNQLSVYEIENSINELVKISQIDIN